MIEWDPIDVLTCLESEPAVDHEATSYHYMLSRDGLVLALEVAPYISEIWLSMRLADQSGWLIDIRMEGCRAIRYLSDDDREELYFLSFDDRSQWPVTFRDGLRLQVRPRVAVMLGDRPAT